jgi:hypothetical protein
MSEEPQHIAPAATPERLALLQGLAQQAAAWWRQQLEDPGYLSKFNNGDRSQAGETAQIMASMAALRSPNPPATALDCFEQVLTQAVLAHLLREPSPSRSSYEGAARYLTLRVDYGPEGELRKAAEAARVSGFPWKTTMWVNWDADAAKCYLEVKRGYGAATERLTSQLGQAPVT